MSQTLGPIHHWIFEQVGLVEGRGPALAAALAATQGEEATLHWKSILEVHPGAFAGEPLEEQVEGSIHATLDGMIAVVQAREAALAAWAAGRDGGLADLAAAYAADGKLWGERAREAAGGADDARRIHALLRELWLEGMPCDVRLEPLAEGPDAVAWARPDLPLSRHWQGAAVTPEQVFALHLAWQEAFVAACGEGFALAIDESPFAGGERFRFRIARAAKEG